MPLYEFHCDKCDRTHERFQWGTQRTDTIVCPDCGEYCRKMISVTAPPEERFARRWHTGVGAYVESTSDVNRIAKEKGLEFVGRDHGG
jgi:putative FmdB family regulatory protein